MFKFDKNLRSRVVFTLSFTCRDLFFPNSRTYWVKLLGSGASNSIRQKPFQIFVLLKSDIQYVCR